MHDFRYALRTMFKSPSFAVVAIVTLALGIGLNTAIFSVVNTVLLKPLDYQDPDRLVAVNSFSTKTGRSTPRLTGGDLVDIRNQADTIEALTYYIGGEMGIKLKDRAEFTSTFQVTPDIFRVFQASPAYGRAFRAGEEQSAVVSLSFAQRNFGDPARALGQTLSFENVSYEIVGVMPRGFEFPKKADIWVPAPLTPANLERSAYNYRTVARVKAGVPLETAQAQLTGIGTRLATAYPASNREKTFQLTPLQDQWVNPIRSTLYFLMGAVSLVLLISCANVANLLLARATGRSREMAVRAALGAGRWRIIRQLTAESLVLAAIGGMLGLLLAYWTTGLLLRLAPENLPRLDEVHVDPTVLAFASLCSLASTLLFGLAPAWHASRIDLNDALKQGGSRGLVGGSSNRTRNALVVAEVALCVILSVGAGLLFRSFLSLNAADLGFRADKLLVMYAHSPANNLDEHLRANRTFERAFTQVSSVPGVKSVSSAMGVPAGRYGSNGMYAVEGKHTFAPGQNLPQAGFRLTGPGYFATMGIPLLRGRDFTLRDQYDAPPVAIISDALARQTFPGEDPIGRRIQCGLDSPDWMTVVGIVGDVRQQSPASTPGPELYMPLSQPPWRANEIQVVIRTGAEPGPMVSAVRQTMQSVDPSIATKFTTMETMVSDSIAAPRFRTFLAGTFAMLALLLAIAGVYGVMSYFVTQRTAELGVRIALGASASDVFRLIVGRALLLTGIGLALGLAGSLAAARVIASLLFGLEATDVLTYTGVILAVALVAALAAVVPALRAMRIDPVVALRQE